MTDAGKYENRDPPNSVRNWAERAFTIGIGGPVGRSATIIMIDVYGVYR